MQNDKSSKNKNNGKKAKAKAKVRTPRSRAGGPPTVAVFGAGIAGLTAAHELAERGFKVTVYEAAADSRATLPDNHKQKHPPVKLGGLAATQFLAPSELWKFPRSGRARKLPDKVAAGDHGFRFFPAYYLHIWDTLRRIPLYEADQVTARTVYDNVRRVIAQAGTAPNKQPSLVFPREAPRSIAELAGSYQEMVSLGYTPTDLSTFFGRMSRYVATSPQRREDELEEVSIHDYLVGYDPKTGKDLFDYSPAFDRQIANMPRILAAFDARYGDARTNLTTYIQLNMSLDRYDSKADGVLNAPTTLAWFDPWYEHLDKLGVDFVQKQLRSFDFVDTGDGKTLQAAVTEPNLESDATIGPDLEAEVEFVNADYYVVATDAFRAELATAQLRKIQGEELANDPDTAVRVVSDLPDPRARQRVRNLSAVLGLEGFATIGPPENSPYEGNRETRNPLHIDSLGQQPWDRFQTLSGIQFYFDTEFQVLRGHVYYSRSKWGLSSINQSGLWLDKPRLAEQGYVSIMSVDIGDWTVPGELIKKPANKCTRNELVEEVWYQLSTELGSSLGEEPTALQLPQPRRYSVDTFIHYDEHTGLPTRNAAPYLIPIVGDWKNRPGAYPWNPSGSSPTWLPDADFVADQKKLRVWQAGHGGYLVHFDKLVFAGTWCKTFTRITSMEAASESARHAVNAILDHYLYTASNGTDLRGGHSLPWRMPYGFVDQELSSPIRFPTEAGDYCFVFDCENREPADARPTRLLDAECFAKNIAHPWTLWGLDQAAVTASNIATNRADASFYDPAWIIEQLRQWRRVLELMFGDDAPDGRRAAPAADATCGGPRSPSRLGLKCVSASYPAGTRLTAENVLTPGAILTEDAARPGSRRSAAGAPPPPPASPLADWLTPPWAERTPGPAEEPPVEP